MPTNPYSSAGLLSRFNLWAGRPDAATQSGAVDSISDDVKYQYLADAEQFIIERLSAIDAKIFYRAPTLMTSSDGGITYTFGTDVNGNPLFPMGRTQIFQNVNCNPGFALRPGYDYLDEGTQIRCCNNVPIPAPLYWYGLAPVGQLSATVQPVLLPPPANMCTVRKAVADFAESANLRNAALADRMTLGFEREFGVVCTLIRKHLRGSPEAGRLLTPWAAGYGSSLSSSFST